MHFFGGGGGGSGVAYKYVDRGYPTTWDKTTGNFTRDGAIHQLDLSAIVPSNAKLVTVRFYVQGSTANHWAGIGHPNATSVYQLVGVSVTYPSSYGDAQVTVPISSAGIISYLVTGTQVTSVNLVVHGWWIEG